MINWSLWQRSCALNGQGRRFRPFARKAGMAYSLSVHFHFVFRSILFRLFFLIIIPPNLFLPLLFCSHLAKPFFSAFVEHPTRDFQIIIARHSEPKAHPPVPVFPHQVAGTFQDCAACLCLSPMLVALEFSRFHFFPGLIPKTFLHRGLWLSERLGPQGMRPT